MKWLILTLLLLPALQHKPAPEDREKQIARLIDEISESGRVFQIAEDAPARAEPPPQIAPGDPPLLAFRYLDGEAKHRFGKLDLVMDDAGH
jgi:hypothetical protein